MANRLRSNVYIIDSAQTLTGLTWPTQAKIHSVAFYSTDTTGELKLVLTADTRDAVVHIRNNQAQPFTLPLYLGGVWMDQLTPIVVTAGTGFIYFV